MRFCFIGCGSIGHTVAKEITAGGKHRIVSVFSKRQEKASAFAELYGARTYSTLLEAARDPDVEGIYICTPHALHYREMLNLIPVGKPILCEKAFTINARQAKKICGRAKEAGVLLTEAMWMYFNPNIIKLAEIAKSGKLGKIKSIKAAFCFNYGMVSLFGKKDRMVNPQLGAGALLDLTIYPIALSYLLLGYPDIIESDLSIKNGYDHTDKITLKYNNGAICTLQGSLAKTISETAVIQFEKGTVRIPHFHYADSITVSGNIRKTFRAKHGYIYEFDRFERDYNLGNTECSVVKHSTTTDIMKIMDECRRQANFKYPDNIEEV